MQFRYILTLCYLSIGSAVAQTGSVTITSLDSYQSARACLQACVYTTPYIYGLVYGIACSPAAGSVALNNCYCRSDLRSSATSFLSKCVGPRCNSAQVDIDQAINIYDEYCAAVGGSGLTSSIADEPTTTPPNANESTESQPGSTQPPPESSTPESSNRNAPSPATVTIYLPSKTATGEAGESPGGLADEGQGHGNGGLHKGYVIAIVIGVLAVLLVVVILLRRRMMGFFKPDGRSGEGNAQFGQFGGIEHTNHPKV
ncbi:hypothetical protein ABW20_dc0107420 [Dactylellina cionopaga]|nr:hypothetical protein ABW20_dc0107420 [Dactylellina cionopaga]